MNFKLATSAIALAIGLGVAAPSIAQEVTYTVGSAPIVASANQTVDAFERQTGALEAIILNGAVTSTTDLGTSATDSSTVTTNANTAAATVVSNSAVSSLDIGLVAGTGATSNGVIASALENNTSDAFANVSATVVTSTVSNPASGSAVSLSDNTLSAATTLATATNTLQGDINLTFANTDDGAVNTGAAPATSTAGLLISSAQVNNDVQNDTPNDTGATFAGVTGDSNVVLTLEDSAATGGIATVTANVNDNTASASFVGNTVDNLLDVQAGNLTTLSSSAGINNVQSNDNVGVSGTTALTNALVDSDVGITATVASDDALSNSTINVTGNTLSSGSTLSSAESDLVVAAGISVAGPSDDSYAPSVIGSLTSTTSSADLFVANTQNSQDSVSRAVTNGDDGIDVSVASGAGGEVTASSILTSSNELSASASGNTNDSSLTVTDSTSFVGLVASSNVQSFTDNTDDTLTSNVAATTSDPRLAISIAEGAGATVSGSTLRADENELSASAVVNASSSAVSVTGTDVSSGKDVSDELSPNAFFINGVSGGSDIIQSTTRADIVAVNQQVVADDGIAADTVVSATLADTADSAISLTVGDDDAVTNSTLSVDRNDLTATAGSNEAATSVSVSANTLTGSSGVVNNQDSVGAVAAVVDDMNVALTVDSDGAATSALSLSADANTIAGSAAGNIGTNTLDVTAGTQTFVNTVSLADPTASRNTLVLSGLDNAGVGNQASAELSVLSAQETKGEATQSVSSNVDDSNVAATLAVAGQNLTATSLSVDSNVMSASARANVVTNTLDADVDSLSLTGAVRDTDGDTNSAGGTNIAAVGSLQANALAVTANLDTDTDNTSINAEITATGTVDDVTLSADANRRTAFASGNTATNTLELSGGSIVTLESAAPDPSLTLLDDATTDITASNTAIALGNEQRNSGAISANVATTADDQIQAVVTGAATVTDTTVSMDRNTVLAQARGASAATNNVRIGIADIDPATGLPVADEQNSTSIQTSVLVGSSQENSGAITANAGTGGTAEIEIGGGFTGGTQTRVTLSADSNVVGAEATALVDNSSLTVGSADATSVLASNSNVADGDVGIDFTAGTSVVTVADYAVSARQTNSADGDVTVAADNLLIDLDAASLVTGSVSADGNLLTGQATGISGSTAVTVTAGDLGSAGSAPVLAGSSIQTNAGDVSGTLEDAAIEVDVFNLASVAGSAESVSIDSNRLLAQATGVTGTNAVTASATTGAGALTTAADGGINNSGASDTFTAEADRMLVSDQTSTGAVTANVAQTAVDANPRLELRTGGGNVEADSLSIASNTIQGQARAIVGANTLTNTAGTSMNASSALVANQDAGGTTSSTVTEPRIVMTTLGSVRDSTLDVVSNTVSASASQLGGTNTLTATGGAIDGGTNGALSITDTAGAEIVASSGFSTLTSVQRSAGSALATIADDGTNTPATISALAGTTVTGGSVSVDLNTIEAATTAVSGANTLAQSADTAQAAGSSASIASVQNSDQSGNVAISTVAGVDVSLVSSGNTTGSDLSVDSNTVQGLATGLTVANVLDIDAGGTITGAAVGDVNVNADGTFASAADYTIASTQRSIGNVFANIDADQDGTDPTIRLTNGAGNVSGSTFSLASNTVRAQAIGITATNSADADFNTATSATFGVSSDQDGNGTIAAGIDSPQLNVTTGGIVDGSTVAASTNQVLASGTGLSAANTLTTGGSSIDGAAASTLTATDTDGSEVVDSTASAVVSNVQNQSASVTARIDDTATSVPTIRVDASGSTTQAVRSSTVDVDSNVLQAAATLATATNTLAQDTTTSQADGSGAQLVSIQNGGTAGATSVIEGGSIGFTANETALSSSVSADGNTVQGLSSGLVASNTLDIDAGTAVSGNGTGVIQLNGTASSVTSDVDYALSSSQVTGAGTIAANLDVGGASSAGALISVDLGNGNFHTGTTASVSSNTMRAQAIGGQATNAASADVGSFATASIGLVNDQTIGSAITADIDAPVIQMTGASVIGDSALSVSDNLMVASGTAASATNALSVDAATTIDGGGDGVGVARLTAGSAPVFAIDPGTSDAGDPVATMVNAQVSTGAVTTDIAGAGTISPAMRVTIGAGVDGTVDVDGNTMLAQSRGNVATSSLALNAGSTLQADAQGILANTQARETGAITASVAGVSSANPGSIGFSNTNAPITGTISVDNNTVRASGAANVAMNSFTVDAGLIGTPSGAATLTAGNIETNAQFAALNAQQNASAVTVDVTNFAVALNQVTGGGSSFNGSASLSGNLVMADATGNSATNMMTLASGGSSYGTASFVNNQVNSAALSAVVTGASVAMTAGGSTNGSNGAFTVGGNSIMASATGNAATTSLSRAGFGFSND